MGSDRSSVPLLRSPYTVVCDIFSPSAPRARAGASPSRVRGRDQLALELGQNRQHPEHGSFPTNSIPNVVPMPMPCS